MALSEFQISHIEIIALRKLEIVSLALAMKLGGLAGREQDCLARTLGEVLNRYEILAAPNREGKRSK